MNNEVNIEDAPLDLSARGVWQRLPDESISAYTAFCSFLEMGSEASLRDVAAKFGKSYTAIRQLSSRNHWSERAAAYQQHLSHSFYAAAYRERAKQTELCQMRDQIFRQQMWQDAQNLRIALRQALDRFTADPEAKIAPYEIARFFELCFKLGCRANAPTGFTSDGPVPPSEDFKAAMAISYGPNRDFGRLLEIIKGANPGKEALIDEKLGPSSSPTSPTQPSSF